MEMDQTILVYAQTGLLRILEVSAPTVLVALVVGLIVSLIQATTQIQEQSLTFVPKLVSVFLVLILFGDKIFGRIQEYAVSLLSNLPH